MSATAAVRERPGAAGQSRRFLRFQQAALFAAAATAFIAVALSRVLPAWCLWGFAAAWAAGLLLRERPWRLFAATVNLSTIAGVLLLLAPALRDRARLPVAAAEAALVLCGNRLLVRRTGGDDGLLHLSCWLVLASGAGLTGELSYGLCLLAFAAIVAVSMLLAELRRGIEEESPEQAQALRAAPELTSTRLLGFAASLGLFAAAFGALLFPLFPRAQLGYLGLGGLRPATGLSDRVDLSGTGTLADSSRLVLQAQLQGDLRLARYWRALTLDHFTGRGWSVGQPVMQIVPGVGTLARGKLHGTFELSADASRLVPVPEKLDGLWPVETDTRLRAGDNGDLRLVFSAPQRDRFLVTAGDGPAVEPDARELARDLQLTDLSPRLESLARQLIPDGTGAEKAIAAVERYLGGFRYTRELDPSEHPLEDFLDRKSGHCQLFASLTTVLLRARGIPARYVAGYYPGTPRAGELIVREWDAHAWTEVYVRGKGFVLVDNTPEDMRGGRQSHTALWQRLLDLWDDAQLGWLHGIINFDSTAQADSAGWLVRHLQASLWSLISPSRITKLRLLYLALLFGVAYWIYRLPRRPDEALRLERALFDSLAARGLPRAPAETYEEALAKLHARDAALARQAEPILARLAAARFGGRQLGSGESDALRSRIRRL